MSIGLCASPHVFSSPSPEVMSAPASTYCLAEVRNYYRRRGRWLELREELLVVPSVISLKLEYYILAVLCIFLFRSAVP